MFNGWPDEDFGPWIIILLFESDSVFRLFFLVQVLHLQNKQVIVVSTTVTYLPPSAQSDLVLLSVFILICLVGDAVFFYIDSLTLYWVILAPLI